MFKPLNNRVLIRPDLESEKTTASGIILDISKEKPATGTVVVGTDAIPAESKVLFSKYGFDEVEVEGKKHYVVPIDNVLGIFD